MILLSLFIALALALAPQGAMAHDAVGEFDMQAFPQPHAETTFIDDFGFARAGHRHQGNDLMGEKLWPVVAAADGTISHIGDGATAGIYIVVDHGDGWETWYLHLNNDTPGTDDGRLGPAEALPADVVEGAPVDAGQLLGLVGDSGNAEWTAPHTHFEIRHHGQAVNPYSLLAPSFRAFLAEQAQTVPL